MRHLYIYIYKCCAHDQSIPGLCPVFGLSDAMFCMAVCISMGTVGGLRGRVARCCPPYAL